MSRITTNRILFLLAIGGASVSAYLTMAHLGIASLTCTAVHGCEEVALDAAAMGLGVPLLHSIPTAAIGLIMYVTLIALSVVRAANPNLRRAATAATLQRVIALLGLTVTAWLTWREAHVIHAWCQWCLASAAIVILITFTCCLEAALPALPAQPNSCS